MYEPTRRAIVEAGIVVHLEASPETTEARVAADEKDRARPLRGNVRRIMDQRAAIYAQADFSVATDVLTPEEVADEVVRLYQTYGERAFNRPGRVEALLATALRCAAGHGRARRHDGRSAPPRASTRRTRRGAPSSASASTRSARPALGAPS